MTDIFISYSHEDEAWKDALLAHLRVLQQHGDFSIWDDRQINVGNDWLPEIESAISSAKVAVLMVSRNYLTSDFITQKEIKKLLRFRQERGLRVIPVIVRPCAWQAVPWLANLQGATKDNLPLSRFEVNSYELEAELSRVALQVQGGLTSIAAQGNKATKVFFRDLNEGGEQLNEAKLIIVGEPGAGKTTLMKKLINPNYQVPQKEDSTLGIQIYEGWQFPRPEQQDIIFTTNVWDFGGQEIQYMTHQFFLTSGSVYLLVSANDRKETKATFRYWFRVINLLGNDKSGKSPVIVVLNDKNGRFINQLDLLKYKKQYPNLDINLLDVNLSENEGRLATLRSSIQHKLTCLKHVTDPRPANWGAVRDALRERAEDVKHINFGEYTAICKQHGVTRIDSQKVFSGYLHKLGSILHFWEDAQLRDFIILDPQWAVDAVYSVLVDNSISDNHGRFTQEKLESIWKGKYDLIEQGKLLGLMSRQHFEICYPLEGENDTYIAPQLLNETRPNYSWESQSNLHFRFRYNFMPEGIITRLIVRLYHLIDSHDNTQLVWRTGIILTEGNCRAKVLEEYSSEGQDVIDVAISGSSHNQKELLIIIRKEIEAIHNKWFENIEAEQMIPCNCKACTSQDNNAITTLSAY